MSATETTVEATSMPTSELIAAESLRSMTMSTMPEQLRHMMEHVPVRERIEMIPFQEMLDRLPVQEVIERLPQRFRPEPPPKRSKMPLLLGLLALAAIVAFVMMKRRRGADGGESAATDTGMIGVVPTTGVGVDEETTLRSSASLS